MMDHTVKKDLHEIGIIAMQTSFGHSVPVYDIERKNPQMHRF